jgi:tetratricopeptide (TPR) repeat protein
MMRNLSNNSVSRLFILGLLLFSGLWNQLSAQVSLREEEWVLPTYPVEPPEKSPVFFMNESYQGASKKVYPLPLNDMISNERTEKAWKALFLENEYIKLCVTPEIGGKLYYAEDKTNNYNFIYRNNVVKPSNIGMTGAWVSGGIEWCVLHHHRPSTFLDVDYSLAENADGSKTIWIGETEPRHRMRWTIGITMFPDRSYFQTEIRIHNPTPFTHTFLYWANVAAHANENYQTIFPPSVQFATFHSKTNFTRWPISTEVYMGMDFTKGVDISWWKNVLGSASFFSHDLKEDFMGGYDHGKQSGTVHIGDHNIVKGAKLWEWGSGPRGQATEARLTENDGPYVEIMTGGYSDNQPDYSWIRPNETKIIHQYWYPVKDIQGFKNANLNGAVNLEKREKNSVFLGYYSTKKIEKAKVLLKSGDKVILQQEVEISPAKTFTATLKLKEAVILTDLYTELVNTATGEVLLSYQPVEQKKIEDLPGVVKNPPAPKDIATVEELYLAGSRIEQFHNPRLKAMDYYMEALARDPGDIRTNTAVGNYYLKNGDYSKARAYLAKAITRLTKDYTRPSDGEPLYLQGLTLKALELYDEAIDTLYRATWDYAWHSAAYLELAKISGRRGDDEKALQQVEESLSTNARNNRAIAFKAALQRRLGKYHEALATLGGLPVSDPLDFRIANEYYLTLKALGEGMKAEKVLADLKVKMRDFVQNYLETATGYLDEGLLREAEDVLMGFTGKDPIVDYYLGYIQHKNGNPERAAQYFASGSAQSIDYVFPFRLETISVLETALSYNPADSKACYYIGNILYDMQPAKAIVYWERAVSINPDFAMAQRNLGWGYYRHEADQLKAVAAYEKAIALDRSQSIYYSELDALYEMTNASLEKRLALFERSNEIVKSRDDAFVRQINVLTLAGKADKAVEYLSGMTFSYREGNSRAREVIIDAQLMLGRKYFEEKDFQKALDHFFEARIPDEEAGSARSGNRDIQVNYHIGLAYEALNDKAKAKAYYKLAAEQSIRRPGYMSYYQGLAYVQLGDAAKGKEIFDAMVAEGERQLTDTGRGNVDAFAIFGEREAESTRKTTAYTIRGLGYKGLGQNDKAIEDLTAAVELSHGNLWAKAEMPAR